MHPNNSVPVIKKGWMRAVLFLFAYFSCAILAGIVSNFILTGSFTVIEGKGLAEQKLSSIILTVGIATIFIIALTVIFRRFIDRRSIISMGFQWAPFQADAFTGFNLGITLLGFATLLLHATGNLEWSEAHFIAGDLSKGFILMLLIAITEELVFRAYILNNLLDSLNKWVALGVSAGMFTLAHASNPGISSVAVANILLAGALLGINYIYTRNLWFAIFFHFSWNFIQGPILGYTVSGLPLQGILQPDLKGPWWLTGGSFGLEGSFITTCVLVLTLLFLYITYEKNTGKTVKASQ
jgi:membrane protease YdiL (CAAX protease family)